MAFHSVFNNQALKAVVGQRLSAAAEEIFVLFEEAAVVYKSEICRLQKETERQRRLLDAVYNPQVVLEKEWVDLLTPDQPSLNPDSLRVVSVKEEIQQVSIKQETVPFPLTIAEAIGVDEEPFVRRQNAENNEGVWELERGERAGATSADGEEEWASRASPSMARMRIQRVQGQWRAERGLADSENQEDHDSSLSDAGSKLKLQKCECGRVYASKEDLYRHMQEHIREKPFRCSVCGKTFTQKGAMKVHMRIHTGEKRFQCHFCDKRFTQMSTCNVHMKVHTRAVAGHVTEKPFKCPVCQKSFKIKPYLQAHLLVHTEKPFRCSECSKSFRRKVELKKHILIHTRGKIYSCKTCNAEFGKLETLRQHIRVTHVTEKTVGCTVCSRKFKDEACLQSHMAVHTGNKPYRCSICNTGFTQRSNLSSHMKRHRKPSQGHPSFHCAKCNVHFVFKENFLRHMATNCGESSSTVCV